MKSTTRFQLLAPAMALMTLGTWAACGMARADDGATSRPASEASSSATQAHASKPRRLSPEDKTALDRTGRTRVGKASFYAKMFAGRTMADGTPMQPAGSNAASRTLPLGTTAKVTNLETGQSAVVTIQDRGPYVDGRIVDLSPGTAQAIGLSKRKGVTKVEVTPITVPLPNGGVKLGQAADDPIVALNERRDRGNVSQEQWDRWN